MRNIHGAQTAIHRKKASAPAKYLYDRGLLQGRILDFGCGRGDLHFLGISDLWEWDPAHQPAPLENGKPREFLPIKQFDTVYCGYVLNVISSKEENNLVLPNLRKYINYDGNIFIAVRRDIPKNGTKTQRYVTLPHEVVRETSNYCIYRICNDSANIRN